MLYGVGDKMKMKIIKYFGLLTIFIFLFSFNIFAYENDTIIYQENANLTLFTNISRHYGAVFFNYTIPNKCIDLTWQIYHSYISPYNITIPDDCRLNSGIIELRYISAYTNGYLVGYGECYNGTDWKIITFVNNLTMGLSGQGSEVHSNQSINAIWDTNGDFWFYDTKTWRSMEKGIGSDMRFSFLHEEALYLTLHDNVAPIFNYTMPDFSILRNDVINYTNYYFDLENDSNITIIDSCNLFKEEIINESRFNIFHFGNNILNKTYCNLTICDLKNCTISNNFYIEIKERPYNYAFLDLRERDNIMILGLLVICYLTLLIFGIYSKQIVIKSFGVILGLVIGIILFQIHWILFLMFVLQNLVIWVFT